MSIQKSRIKNRICKAAGLALLLAASVGCASLERARDLHKTGDCDRAFEVARERYGQEVLYKKPGVVLGTAASAGLTGLAGAGGVVAGGTALILLCSPFILLDAATGGTGEVAGPCIEVFDEVAGEIIAGSFTGTWEGTKAMRTANYDHVAQSLRGTVECYLTRQKSEDLNRARSAYLFLMNNDFQEDLSSSEQAASWNLAKQYPQLRKPLPGESGP